MKFTRAARRTAERLCSFISILPADSDDRTRNNNLFQKMNADQSDRRRPRLAAPETEAEPPPEPWTPERVSEWNAYYDFYVKLAAFSWCSWSRAIT